MFKSFIVVLILTGSALVQASDRDNQVSLEQQRAILLQRKARYEKKVVDHNQQVNDYNKRDNIFNNDWNACISEFNKYLPARLECDKIFAPTRDALSSEKRKLDLAVNALNAKGRKIESQIESNFQERRVYHSVRAVTFGAAYYLFGVPLLPYTFGLYASFQAVRACDPDLSLSSLKSIYSRLNPFNYFNSKKA